MRIIINGISARAGGGVTYLLKLLELLPQMVPEAVFLAVIPDIEVFTRIKEQSNLEIIRVSEASTNLFRRYYWENTGLISLCRTWRADLLFCVANVIPLIDPGIPIVLMVQNAAPLTLKVIKMLWRYESAAKSLQMLTLKWLTLVSISRANKIIALSNATARLIKRLKPSADLEVLYHGISCDFNPYAPRPKSIGPKPYFLYVSNLYVYKGLEYIVKALAYDRSLPRVLIVGRAYDAHYVEHVKRQAVSAGVADRIEFLNDIPHEQLPGYYANAIAMIYPSWCENCPNILLESMACGCPVVAMNIGPMPEICGDAACYANPFSGKSLALAMRRVLDLKPYLSKRAVERAAAFTWEKAMLRHKEILCWQK